MLAAVFPFAKAILPSVIVCPDATFLELTDPEPVRLSDSPLTRLLNVVEKEELSALLDPS